MATIKGFYMKNISPPRLRDGVKYRKGVIYKDGEKAAFFFVYENGKPPHLQVYQHILNDWDGAANELYREQGNDSDLSPNEFMVERFVELIDFEKRYRIQQSRGKTIMVEYRILKRVELPDGENLMPTGKRVLFNANDMNEVDDFEAERMAGGLFERMLFSSPDDFIYE